MPNNPLQASDNLLVVVGIGVVVQSKAVAIAVNAADYEQSNPNVLTHLHDPSALQVPTAEPPQGLVATALHPL